MTQGQTPPTALDDLLNKKVQDASSNLMPTRPAIRFLGCAVTDNPANGSTDVTPAGAAGGGQINLTLANGLNSNVATDGSVFQRIGGPTTAYKIGGLVPSAGVYAGKPVILSDTTGQSFTIVNEDPSSTAANRIRTPNGKDYQVGALGGTASCQLYYDTTLARFVLTHNGPQLGTHLNVLEFGAVGDGVTDDAPAINRALAAATTSQTVLFPRTAANIYLIKSPLLASSNAGQIGIVITGQSRAIDAEVPSFQTVIQADFAPLASGTAATIASIGPDTNGVQVMTLTGLSSLGAVQVGDTVVLSNCRVTTTTSDFTQPFPGGNVIVAVTNNDWMTLNGTVTLSTGDMYYVSSKNVDGVHVTLTAAKQIGGTAPTATVHAGATVTPDLWGTAANNGPLTVASVGSNSLTCVASFLDEATSQILNTGTDGNNGSIHWTIVPAMLRLFSRECTVEKLRFYGAGTCGACIDSTRDTGGGATANTSNKFFDCSFGSAIYGIKVADIGQRGTPYQQNCENYQFSRLTFDHMTMAGIWNPNSSGQSKSHALDRCDFHTSPYGYWQNIGSFTAYRSGCGAITSSVMWIAGPTEPVSVLDMDLEDAARVFQCVSSSNVTASISGVRLGYSAPANMAADGLVIRSHCLSGGIRVSNSQLAANQGSSAYKTVAIGAPNGTAFGAMTVTIENCTFGRIDPFICQASGGGNGAFLSIGNAYSSAGTATPIPNGILMSARLDGADSLDRVTPYPSAPWMVQSLGMAPNVVTGYIWTIAAGDNNNLAATPNTVNIINAAAGDFGITGILPPTQEGEIREIVNKTAHAMTIRNASGSSTAANQIHTLSGSDQACSSIRIQYLTQIPTGAAVPGWYELSHT